jgi:hypothetical protein
MAQSQRHQTVPKKPLSSYCRHDCAPAIHQRAKSDMVPCHLVPQVRLTKSQATSTHKHTHTHTAQRKSTAQLYKPTSTSTPKLPGMLVPPPAKCKAGTWEGMKVRQRMAAHLPSDRCSMPISHGHMLLDTDNAMPPCTCLMPFGRGWYTTAV